MSLLTFIVGFLAGLIFRRLFARVPKDHVSEDWFRDRLQLGRDEHD
jgi:hypothetical protein